MNVSFISDRRMALKTGGIAAVLIATILAGCGGGSDEDSRESSQAQAPQAIRSMGGRPNGLEAANIDPSIAPIEQQFTGTLLAGSDQTWDPTAVPTNRFSSTCFPLMFSENIFVKVGSVGNEDDAAGLVSRNAACVTAVADPLSVQADLMFNTGTGRYEFFRPEAGFPLQTMTIGEAVVETRFGVQAAPQGSDPLSMQVVIAPKIMRYTPTLALFDSSNLKIKLEPTWFFGPGTTNGSTITHLPPTLSGSAPTFELPLSTGASAEIKSVLVKFNWTYSLVAGAFDFASFRLYPSGYSYGVDPQRGATFGLTDIDTPTARMPYSYNIRCDRGVVRANTSGCVFSDASPVFWVRRIVGPLQTKEMIAEAALHIYSAQRNLFLVGPSPQSFKAPGQFKLRTGTRAVADPNGETQFAGLSYMKDDGLAGKNRAASCGTDPSALIKSRGEPRSSSCPVGKSTTCQCDEYPFAMTRQGGFFAPQSTSVRYVLGQHNGNLGSMFSTFLVDQRVLPEFAGVDYFWVDVEEWAP